MRFSTRFDQQSRSPHTKWTCLYSSVRMRNTMTQPSCACNSQLCSVLYPGDGSLEGKELRLKQQYMLCSASLQVTFTP